MSRMPSRAMLITPERSETTPPIAASAYGIVMRSTCERNASDSKLTSHSAMLALRGTAGVGVGRCLQGGGLGSLDRASSVRGRPRHGEDDDGLQDLDELLGHLLGHAEAAVR